MHLHLYWRTVSLTRDLLDGTKAGLGILHLLGSQDLHRGIHVRLAHELSHRGSMVVLNLPPANLSVLATCDVLGGERARGGPRDVILNAHHVLSSHDACESHLSPVFSPAVSHDPVVLARLLVLAKADDGNNVVGLGGSGVVVEDSSLVVSEGVGVDGGCDGSAGVDFGFDLVNARGLVFEHAHDVVPDFSVFCDSGIREVVQFYTFSTSIRES
mmetsp:Transcript_6337/g.8294  ORF Transcript_6337/g.8294 Transcript_6337/m.8294 type:complete len:214 (+) Transcript_6337:73-714(+)